MTSDSERGESQSNGGFTGFLAVHRARIARLVLIGGLIAVFLQIAPHVPRDTALDLRLGDAHADVVAIQLELLRGDDLLRSVELRYAQGAPRAVQRQARLPAGEIDLRAQLTLRDGRVVRVDRHFTTPASDAVRIDLSD